MILGVDIDETLTNESCWTREQVLSATPNTKIIQLVNDLYFEGHTIILYTCRGDSVIPATRCWLKEQGVKYHALNNNKLWADYYLDDRSVHPDKLNKEYAEQLIKIASQKRDRDKKPPA